MQHRALDMEPSRLNLSPGIAFKMALVLSRELTMALIQQSCPCLSPLMSSRLIALLGNLEHLINFPPLVHDTRS